MSSILDSKSAWSIIESGAKVVDVRTASEFNAGHLPGAVNIPHDQLAARVAELLVKKEDNIVLYCKSGGRSDFALKLMLGLGFEKAVNAGGYDDLMLSKNSTLGSNPNNI